MRVSAKADYAVRAMVELAAHTADGPQKGEDIALAQSIPIPFLERILSELRHRGLVQSRRGADGGYWLSRLPREVTIAEVVRAVEGPLASVRGEAPAATSYSGAAEPLQRVWIALEASIHDVLDRITLADVVDGQLPEGLAEPPDQAEDPLDRPDAGTSD